MAKISFKGGDNPPRPDRDVSKPVKRQRWATIRRTDDDASHKRRSILNRMPGIHISSYEEKPGPDGKNDHGNITEDSPMGQQQDDPGLQSRNVYVNMPLPESEKDENGHNLQHYPRNKIRTAKYTPISFVPKNLYFQFHNIANIYFLFIIILSVREVSGYIVMRADHISRSFPFSVLRILA
jgi:phospholipid-translocating ATPase